jgi:hypothetical protein
LVVNAAANFVDKVEITGKMIEANIAINQAFV